MWQSLEGKTDRESSIEAALRKLEEEIGLVVESEDFKFLLNDSNYKCDVYTLKVYLNTKLDFMKSDKNGEWKKFSFKTYKRIAREGRITFTYTTYIKLILYRIKQKPQASKRKATKSF